jgi:hypothetical protein
MRIRLGTAGHVEFLHSSPYGAWGLQTSPCGARCSPITSIDPQREAPGTAGGYFGGGDLAPPPLALWRRRGNSAPLAIGAADGDNLV